MSNPFENPHCFIKQAGFGDMMSGAMSSMSGMMPMAGGALAGAGAGAGLGGMMGNAARPISAIIGAAMGAYAASKVDAAITQNNNMGMNNAMGVDMNGQLGIQNALMNLDQQGMLMGQDPYAMGMGMPPMDPNMGMGMPPMGGQGMGMPPMDPNMGMMPPMGPNMGMMPPMQQDPYAMGQGPQVATGQGAMQTMQKKSSAHSIDTEARAAVYAYFDQ